MFLSESLSFSKKVFFVSKMKMFFRLRTRVVFYACVRNDALIRLHTISMIEVELSGDKLKELGVRQTNTITLRKKSIGLKFDIFNISYV